MGAKTEDNKGIETVKTIRTAMFFPSEFCDKMIEHFGGIEKVLYNTSIVVDEMFGGKICPYSTVKAAEKEVYRLTGMVS